MTEEPNLILMDIDLPALNGRRCLAALRERGVMAPAILITGTPSNESDVAVLSKPFTAETLEQAIIAVPHKPRKG